MVICKTLFRLGKLYLAPLLPALPHAGCALLDVCSPMQVIANQSRHPVPIVIGTIQDLLRISGAGE